MIETTRELYRYVIHTLDRFPDPEKAKITVMVHSVGCIPLMYALGQIVLHDNVLFLWIGREDWRHAMTNSVRVGILARLFTQVITDDLDSADEIASEKYGFAKEIERLKIFEAGRKVYHHSAMKQVKGGWEYETKEAKA